MQTFEKTTLLTWVLGWSWWLVYPPFAALEIRLLWAQTWLTWTQGEQMIGFTLMHVYPGLSLLGFFGAIGTVLWLLLAISMLVLRRHRLLATGKVQLSLSA